MRPLKTDLRASLIDGASFSVMVGIGETYIAAFALALGLNQVAAGLVATLPMLAGAFLQLVSPVAVQRLGSHRRWVVACALCQATSFLPLVALALWQQLPAWSVFVIATVYWAASMGTSPAWNAWIGTIVPRRVRTRFFAKRTRFSQAGILCGFVTGGLILQWGAANDYTLYAFAALFLIATIARYISAYFLHTQSEPHKPNGEHRHVPATEFLRRLWRGPDGSLLLYLLAVQTAVQLSGPYFTPYMLKQLHLSYVDYMLLIAVAFASKIMALPAMGHVAHRFGARRLLTISGIAIVPMSALWLVTDSYPYLVCVQVFSGVAWGAYELAMFLMLFETIPHEERTSVLTTFNLAHATATVCGSLLGGCLLWYFGEMREIYLTLFGVSSLVRLCTLGLSPSIPATARRIVGFAMRTISLRPEPDIDDRPILASMEEDEGEELKTES